MNKVLTAFLFYCVLIILGWTMRGYFSPAEEDCCQSAANASCNTHCNNKKEGCPPPAVIENILSTVKTVGDTWLTRRLCSLLMVTGFLVILTLNMVYDFLH